MKRFWMVVIGFLACSSFALAAEKLTYIDLINHLTDLERLAILPHPGETCAQHSSYDRASKYDQSTGKYMQWSANRDGSGIIRQENGESVFAEMEGPGCIWRIWSALANQGHVKIYLDGSSTPAVDLPFIGYFNRENEPFTPSALIHRTARGFNCYVPIPYQKSCKIIADKGWGNYYHFNYTTYPKGTILPTFKRELSDTDSIALDRANEILSACGLDPAGTRRGQVTERKQVTVAPGQTAVVTKFKGTRAITALKVKMDLPQKPKDCDVLRELALRIFWDGEDKPSVWSPLGDFFGTAVGYNKYRSLPLGMTEDGFYCYWYMPFKKGALIELTNDGNSERTAIFTITHAPLSCSIKKLGRFHAKWHRDAFLPAEPERRAIDWTMLKAKGRGRFCGVLLHIWNPEGGWWGEGDEKFFVDGEKFPSTIGTGSEDYFGYAWGNPTLFDNCYHNQTFNTGNNKGHISLNRWHITDNVPFQKSFEAAIEKYYPNDKPTLYAVVAYWYQSAGQADCYQSMPVEERTGYCTYTPPVIPKVEGALEAEELQILGLTAGKTRRSEWKEIGAAWSGQAHLLWYEAGPGDMLDSILTVAKAGKYKIKIHAKKAPDYGIVQLHLNSTKLGESIDFYDEKNVPADVMDLGTHELRKGNHIFRVEIVGANDKAVKKYRFGLDYILLEEVK